MALKVLAQALSKYGDKNRVGTGKGKDATSNGHDKATQRLEQNKKRHDQEDSSTSPSTLALTGIVFGSVYGSFFLLCYFLLNTGFSVVENMVFLFFEFLGASHTLEGIRNHTARRHEVAKMRP